LTPLCYAAEGGYLEIVRELLDNCADPNRYSWVNLVRVDCLFCVGRADLGLSPGALMLCMDQPAVSMTMAFGAKSV
jgi:hypothetical protein